MLEIAASCPRCSRIFLLDCPPDGEMPRHLDPLLGVPCPASGSTLGAYLEVASPAHVERHQAERNETWPRWQEHRHRQARGP